MKPNVQRPLNSTYRDQVGRDPKRDKAIVDAPISLGMQRQTKGELGYHHGVTVTDGPNVGLKDYQKPIPVNSGMTAAQAARHAATPSGDVVLVDAQTLGRGKPKNEPRPRPAEKA